MNGGGIGVNEYVHRQAGRKPAAGAGSTVAMTIGVSLAIFVVGMTATHWPAVASTLTTLPTVSQMSKKIRDFTYYRDCAAVRSAGVAPIRKGEPGYRIALDKDGNGLACEPYKEW